MMSSQSELEFLKDQVNRLNGVLSHYQEMYFEKSEKMGKNNLRIVFNNVTAPLLMEYDKIIFEMTEEIQSFKTHIEQEQLRVKAITKENERLWTQAKEVPKEVYVSSSDEMKMNMQAQIDLMIKEKNNLHELLRISDNEVNRLQAEVTEYTMKPQTLFFNEQMESMREQYLSSIHELENEVVMLRDIKKDISNELEKAHNQNCELDKENKMLLEKLRFEKQAAEENFSQLKTGMKRIDYMDNEKKDLMTTIEELKSAVKSHESSKNEWTATLMSLESKYNTKEQQVYEASQKVTEAYQIAESAMAEKKTVEIKEMQMTSECERLRGVIAGILEDAGVRTREEVDLVRSKFDKEIERIMEELNFCEQSRQELIVELDQIKRGKTQLEQEMESFQRSERERCVQDHLIDEANHNRTIRAEREREDIRLQLQSLENSFGKERIDWQRQKESLENELMHLQKKLSNLQMSSDKAQSNADRFSKLLTESEEAAAKNRKKFQESLRNSRHEYEILKQSSQIKIQELETRLVSAEETQRHTTSEMRQFLTKQQQIGAKWRDEAHNLSDQYEERLGQLSKELERYKKRNEDIISLLHESKQQILENHDTIDDHKKTIGLLERRLEISEDSRPMKIEADSSIQDDSSWQLKQFKKQQQRLIKESVARKYDFPYTVAPDKERGHSN